MSDALWLHGTVACQAPLAMEFSRWEYRSGLPFPSPGDLPDPGTEPESPVSPVLAGVFFTSGPPGKPVSMCTWINLWFVSCCSPVYFLGLPEECRRVEASVFSPNGETRQGWAGSCGPSDYRGCILARAPSVKSPLLRLCRSKGVLWFRALLVIGGGEWKAGTFGGIKGPAQSWSSVGKSNIWKRMLWPRFCQ